MQLVLGLALRLLALLSVRTFHSPDEHWQMNEVACRIARGYGYLTWEWRAPPLRAPFLQLLQAALLRLLDLAGIESRTASSLASVPLRFLAIALGDICLFRLAARWGKPSLFAIIYYGNWFIMEIGSRNYLNTYENSCVMAFFYLYFAQWNNSARAVLVLSFLIRPTSIVPMAFYLIWEQARTLREGTHSWIPLLLKNVGTCAAMVSAGVAFDSWWYGELTCTACNFVKLNLLQGVSSLYGESPAYYYVLLILPLTLTLLYPLLLLELLTPSPPKLFFSALILFWSLLAHKEERFIGYLIAASLYFAAVRLQSLSFRRPLVALYLLVNLAAFLFHGLVHNRDKMEAIAKVSDTGVRSLLVVGQCHQYPLYSSIGSPIYVRFANCEPALRRTNRTQSLLTCSQLLQVAQTEQPDYQAYGTVGERGRFSHALVRGESDCGRSGAWRRMSQAEWAGSFVLWERVRID